MIKKMRFLLTATALLSVMLLGACGGRGTKVTSISAKDATVDANWSPEDIQKVRDYMLASLKDSAVNSMTYKKATWMLTKEMANDTDEHINTRVIMERIRTKLINDGMGVFIDDQAMDEILEQQAMQQSDLYDNTKAARVGKLLGAQIILRGRISNIRKKSSRTDMNYYNITLQIVGLETGRILWTDEIEIGRMAQKSRFR
ncbi:MAG: penicillin-binding protein activator LpoB [Spirochaetae bacterium HGW-Spirochaetae-6]|nr:MAG: penicillin-binding protein activator LpoB [Spirochaetae bacterium HGW-Spirochaetae-6]